MEELGWWRIKAGQIEAAIAPGTPVDACRNGDTAWVNQSTLARQQAEFGGDVVFVKRGVGRAKLDVVPLRKL